MSRQIAAGFALAGVVLSLSTPVLSAADDFNRGRPENGVQGSQAMGASQPLSGQGDARQRRGGGAPGEWSGNAVAGNPEARFSARSTEAERLIDNSEKRPGDTPTVQERSAGVSPDPGASGHGAGPGPSIQDRSSEVR